MRACADANRFGYLPDAWVADMAAACASFWSDRFGWALDPARIRPLPDVLTALTAVVEHFTPAGSPVVLPTPAYMPFLTVPGMLGRELVRVPMARDQDRWSLDLDGARRGVRDLGREAAGAGEPAQPDRAGSSPRRSSPG